MAKLKIDHSADPLMPDQFKEYFSKLIADYDYSHALYVLIHCTTGLRYSDMCNITVGQIKSNDIVVAEKKTGKTAYRKLSESVLEKALALIYRLKLTDDDLILKGKLNRHVHVNTMNERLKRDQKKYKIDIGKFSTHSLRKCFGRLSFEANGSNENAYFMLAMTYNHSSVEITKRYLKITQEEVRDFASKIEI